MKGIETAVFIDISGGIRDQSAGVSGIQLPTIRECGVLEDMTDEYFLSQVD